MSLFLNEILLKILVQELFKEFHLKEEADKLPRGCNNTF
jgi:hypothetical protein